MKNVLTILLCLLFTTPKLSAQEEEMQISKNAIELDLFNFDRLYSLNYTRAFVKKKWAIIPKVGIHLMPNRGGSYVTRAPASGFIAYTAAKSNTEVNAGVDFLYGKKKHFLSLGINSMILREFFLPYNTFVDPDWVMNYAVQSSIGYRFQKKKKGIYFSAKLRPFLFRIDSKRNEEGEKVRLYDFDFRDFPFILFPSPGIGYSF